MQVESLDHLVLTVRSIEQTVAFYTTVLGMERRDFGEGRVALHFGQQKINLHPADQVIDQNVRHATPGSADLCLLTNIPIVAVVAHLQALLVPIITGPLVRSGAQGPINSVYVYDPDENLIEIANVSHP